MTPPSNILFFPAILAPTLLHSFLFFILTILILNLFELLLKPHLQPLQRLLQPPLQVFERVFNDQLQDLLMVSYLASLTKSQLAIAERLNASM